MSPKRSKAIVLPSGLTSTFIQVPSSTLIGTWRMTAPGGLLTSHLAGLAGAADGAGPGVGAGAGGGGSGFTAWFSGAWVLATGGCGEGGAWARAGVMAAEARRTAASFRFMETPWLRP